MITIPEAVANLLKNKPFINEFLGEGIINYSALARKLKPEIEKMLRKDIKEGAVVMALKRMPITIDQRISLKLNMVISKMGDITVRSNLSDFTFINSESLREKEKLLIDAMSQEKDGFYTISKGVHETTIVISKPFEEKALKIFKKERLLSSKSKLSSVTIKMPQENQTTPGLYYFLFKKMAENGINIVEVVSTTNEITIIVYHNDAQKAFAAISNLS